jgi:Helix-turn-helix domain
MSDYGFPKFGWMARVLEDDRLTPVARTVLVYCALQYVRAGDDWFCVRQATVAANLHVHVNTVAKAIRRARELGWLMPGGERQRGRGHHQADTYRLDHPEIGTPWSTSFDGRIPTPGSGSLDGEIPTRGSEEYPHGELEIPTRSNAPTSEKNPGTGFISRVYIQGLGAGGHGPSREPLRCSALGCIKPVKQDGLCARHWAVDHWRQP